MTDKEEGWVELTPADIVERLEESMWQIMDAQDASLDEMAEMEAMFAKMRKRNQ